MFSSSFPSTSELRTHSIEDSRDEDPWTEDAEDQNTRKEDLGEEERKIR